MCSLKPNQARKVSVFIFLTAIYRCVGEAKKMLQKYAIICKNMGVSVYEFLRSFSFQIKFHLILATSNHVGEMICQAVEHKKIDFLIIGRRGMSTLKRYVKTLVLLLTECF
jgi:hypothetical protein